MKLFRQAFFLSLFCSFFLREQVLYSAIHGRSPGTRERINTIKVLKVLNSKSLSHLKRLSILREMGPQVLPELKSLFNDESSSFGNRWMALMFFARIGGRIRAYPGLIEALNDRQWFIRSAAARAFGYMRYKRAVPALIETLKDRSLVVRTSAADSLGHIGSRKAIKPLIAVLYDPINFHRGKSLWIRRHAVEALMRIGDPLIMNTLISLLDDQDRKVVKASMKALSKMTGISRKGLTASLSVKKWKIWHADNVKDGKSSAPFKKNSNVAVEFIKKKY